MFVRQSLFCAAVSVAAVLTASGCSSDTTTAAADTPSSTAAESTQPSGSACPVAFSGPNPSRTDVESDISALATDQNALSANFAAALGNPAPAPTTASLSDQQVTILENAPAGALARLSSAFCTDDTLASGMTQRLDAAISASIPDSVEGAPEIRSQLSAVSLRHPVSLLLGTTFDVCGLGTGQTTVTKETNPLAADVGAITIVTNFCPDFAGLFDPLPNR